MEKHVCPITGDEFFNLKGVVSTREKAIRQFEYGDAGKSGLNITVEVPVTFGKYHKTRRVDVVCFNDDATVKILEMKTLKAKAKDEIFARRTDKGLVIDDAKDIKVVKAI